MPGDHRESVHYNSRRARIWATRINIAQTVNGLGWILGPIVGGHFVFSGADGANANAGLTTPYMAIGIFVVLLLIIFAVSRVPDLHVEDEDEVFVRCRMGSNHRELSGPASL